MCLWFGTQDGLNRYDGQGFTVYRHDPGSLSSDVVRSVYVDSSNTPWVGTEGGLDKQVDPVQGAEAYEAALQTAGNQDYQVTANAGHVFVAVPEYLETLKYGSSIFKPNSCHSRRFIFFPPANVQLCAQLCVVINDATHFFGRGGGGRKQQSSRFKC